ncbi:MAG: hypothetical protein ABSF28_07850 [Terracidiphilus sp.]|jgi:hypothetical protein
MGLWSSARYDLHLTDAEFWSLTPRQFSALLHRHKANRDWVNYMVGILASTSANFSMARPKEPLSASDFMLNRKPEEETGIELAERIAFELSGCAIGPTIVIQ